MTINGCRNTMLEFIPKFRPSKPKKLSDEDWLDFEEPQVILFQGMRSSGKGVAVDRTAERLYKEGILILHIWGARSFENLYWAVNKNCRESYSKMQFIVNAFYDNFSKNQGLKSICISKGMTTNDYEKFVEIMKYDGLLEMQDDANIRLTKKGIDLHNGKLLYCKCHRAYPISWIVPDYIEIDKESIDRFNGVYWNDWSEYNSDYIKCRIDDFISKEEFETKYPDGLKKPKEFQPKPLILIKKITTPTSAARKEIFREEFIQLVLEARKQHRVVVLNPAIFEGVMDKFDTITEIMRIIPYLMNKSGHFMPLSEKDVGKPQKDWDKWQRSYHKIAIVINELRSVAPSSRLSGEKDSGKSKKAIFDIIPEMRHMKTWFLGDFQNPDDLYAGVRYQANVIIIKRASRNILGGDWSWLFDKIEYNRKGMLEYRFGGVSERHPKIKEQLDFARPKIDELLDNKGYVTFINNEIKLETFDMPSFHHKTSLEDFQKDTKIKWKVNKSKKSTEDKESTQSEEKTASRQKKAVKEDILQKIDYMKINQHKTFPEIKDELVSMESQEMIPNMGYSEKDPGYFNRWYLRWKKKQNTNK